MPVPVIYWELQHRPTKNNFFRYLHHRYHQSRACTELEPRSVAVSTRCFQCSRSWVYFHAELRPKLWGWKSASRVRSQVWWGRPGGRLQFLGNRRIDTVSDLVMSSDVSNYPSLSRVLRIEAVWDLVPLPCWMLTTGLMDSWKKSARPTCRPTPPMCRQKCPPTKSVCLNGAFVDF